MEVLRVQDLSKTYRSPHLGQPPRRALRGVSFAARAGEVLGVVGPNGAGKSTLFKIVLGLVRPDGGSGEVLGRPLGDPEARRRMGYLPERFRFYPHLSVVEALRTLARLQGLPDDEAAERTEEIMRELGLAALRHHRLGSLSKGWLQRVGLAQALVGDPELLILDEPLSGLDPLGRAQVRDLLAEAAAQGRTVLLSSHILPDVEALAHRVLLLACGEVLEETSVARLLEGSGGMVEVVLRPGRALLVPGGRRLSCDPDGWERWLVPRHGPPPLEEMLRRWLADGARIRAVLPREAGLEARLRQLWEERKGVA
jgi:ABC-2 type transport system ATP-binding protein